MPRTVEYRVSLAERARHLYVVEARFPVENPGADADLTLRLPVWTPGSYLIREYQRHLQELECCDESGHPLAVQKIEKSAWRIATGAATEVRARYRVYAHEVTVRTAHLDHTHGFWNGACLFLYVEALRTCAARVFVDAPSDWRIATALDRDPVTDGHPFLAADYDALVDSPFEIGPHEPIEFVAAGRPHEIAIWGRTPGSFDRERFRDHLARIVETHARMFEASDEDRAPALPYRRYTFILHLVPHAHGGLEHAASCTLLGSPHAFTQPRKYEELLELISHEHFHLWNVKRIHPEALGPFDYTREAHTRSLWVVEGWTSYYDRLALRRAGLLPTAQYLAKLGEELSRLAAIPGRRRQSLEEASFDAWIKHYRPDENSSNSSVSYYLKGSIVALLLDLEIRRRTEGRRSLDDAMRLLWREHGQSGRGYADGEIQALVERAAGVSLEEFFARAVRGREELDLDGPLSSVGLQVRPVARAGEEGGAWLGATLSQDGDRLRVTEALEGSPAQEGGLYPGDQIVACEGWRIDKSALADRLSALAPGTRLRFTVFRRDELQEVDLTVAERPREPIEVVPIAAPTPAARAAFRAWLDDDLPG